jgi:hypothetical protein
MFIIFAQNCIKTMFKQKIQSFMRTCFLVVILILGFSNFTKAQITLDYKTQETIDFYKQNKFISGSNKPLTESQIKGSPYLNDDFFPGSIYTTQKQHFTDIPLRYNIYNDDLEFKTPAGQVQALATPEIVEKAVFGSTELVYSPYLLGDKTKKGFFVVLKEGKASLYLKPGVLFREGTAPGAYKDPEPPKFVKKSDDYYIRFETGNAILIGNKKDLIATFPDNQDKIESFISKHKIKTNKPDDLKELIHYYNSL